MAVNINFSQSYFWLDSWILANIIQLATQDFCERFIDYQTDPCRRLYDQMVMAARCGVANIAEGNARYSTSIETEMRLFDVSRASFDEVLGDFFNFLLRRKAEVWKIGNPDREAIWQTKLDPPRYSNSLLHDVGKHILTQKEKFDHWLENKDPEIVANAVIVLLSKENKMLQSHLQSLLNKFKETGGFTENMTKERLESRKNMAMEADAPACPICGKPMFRRVTKKGSMQGREFWGCSDYPNCPGLLPID